MGISRILLSRLMIFEPNSKIKDIVKKSSLYRNISQESSNQFKKEITEFFGFLNDSQSEETQKGFLKTFLEHTYYHEDYLIIGDENRKDLAILGDYTTSTKTNVFIETKSTTSTEMVKRDDLQAKAFYETILYYMNERHQESNFELKYIVITNMYEWCIIDALDYDRLFWRDSYFNKQYLQFINGQLAFRDTNQFYEKIAAPFVRDSKAILRYTYFNLYELTINQDGTVKQRISDIYKILSPKFMFKQYERNDNNHLNRRFYMELLYIMGLEEIEEDSKRIIIRNAARHEGALIENAIEQIKAGSPTDIHIEGDSEGERIYNAALQLTIVWVNRLLFLKLLEAQLILYNNSDSFRFLKPEKLRNYGDLNTLFFRVLAVPETERTPSVKEKYPNVPYLNSSLFEQTSLEQVATPISNLSNDITLPLYQGSVLRDHVRRLRRELSPLEYMLLFLDSFDFGADTQTDDVDATTQKPLISASVLGLIFEKINGYKDGSIFTPSKITMSLCRETLRRAVVDKFNNELGWNCKNIIDVHNNISDKAEANRVINGLRICDPAVGSGHFLVSALNELIAIKSDLSILLDSDGRTLRDYGVDVQNDELVITDENGVQVIYHPSVHYKDSQRVQEVIFNEKKTLIENCLFGVDINPNSVNICRLRLWIELLKSTYYDRTDGVLQTLPNIDINIKCGNSLISKFPIAVGQPINVQSELAKKLKTSIKNYKTLVAEYKEKSDKSTRNQINTKLDEIRRLFLNRGELNLFGNNEVVDYKDPFHNSMEWMLQFPEVLDDEARFVGFDVVIGNPPYINMQRLGEISRFYKNLPGRNNPHKTYVTYASNGDILTLFFELGHKLVRDGGLVSYITSNSWMRTEYGEKTRKFLSEQTNPLLIVDFVKFKVFENVTVEANIMIFAKGENTHQTMAANVEKDDYMLLDSYLEDNLIPCDFNTNDFWYILPPKDQHIRNHVIKVGKQLKESLWNLNVKFGIKTGNNNAFIIDSEQRKKILENCESVRERELTDKLIQKVIKGEDVQRYGYHWNDHYLIATFPSIRHEILLYPALQKYLLSFEQQKLRDNGYKWIADDPKLLESYCRQKLNQAGREVRINNKPIIFGSDPNRHEKSRKRTAHQWFELQDNIAFWREFAKPKLIWKRIGSDVRFAYDETGILSLDSTCIAVGNRIKYLCGIFNSKMGRYLLKYTPKTGTGDSLVSVQAFHPIYVPIPSQEEERQITRYVDKLSAYTNEEDAVCLDALVFNLYGITDDETIRYIESKI